MLIPDNDRAAVLAAIRTFLAVDDSIKFNPDLVDEILADLVFDPEKQAYSSDRFELDIVVRDNSN
jgi:hypothetical protein